MKENANTLPLVVLPCSADKLDYPAKAVDLYLGRGYLPVLKNKTDLQIGRDYHLAFMSAKYGLVFSNEVIAPYDLKMTANQSYWLVENKSDLAKSKLLDINPSKIIACLPKLYLSTLEGMMECCVPIVDVVKPAKGSGIGLQRKFLSVELDKIKISVVSFFVFHNLNSKRQTITTVIDIKAGDVFTSYLGGVGLDRKVSAPVKVKWVGVSNGLPIVVDEYEHQHSLFDIANGLSCEQRESAKKFGGVYEPSMDISTISVPLSQINQHIHNTRKVA